MGFRLRGLKRVINHNEDVILEAIIRDDMSYFKELIFLVLLEIQETKCIWPFLISLWFPDSDITNPIVKYILFKSHEALKLFIFDKQANSESTLSLILYMDEADEFER